MDDWQCHDKSVRYLCGVFCVIINLSSMRSPISGQNEPLWSTLTFTPRGNPRLKLFTPSWRLVVGKAKLHPLRHHFPKIQPLPSTPCVSLSFPPPLSSLYSLLVGCAAWILGLHDVGKLRGSGEGLNPQLLKWIIWENDRKLKHRERERQKRH